MQWRYGVTAGIFFALLSLYPQGLLMQQRGGEYNGATAFFDFDEPAYAAYLQALIDGRPRQNGIYADSRDLQTGETILSIQFLPALALAAAGRISGLSAEQLFLALPPIVAFFTAFLLFHLLASFTGNNVYAFLATIAVLTAGALLAGNGIAKLYSGLGSATISLPFLRRYSPAIAFPFLFLLIGLVWKAFSQIGGRRSLFLAFASATCFAILQYSYFYLWTAVLAWLVILTVTDSVWNREKKRVFGFWLPFFIFTGILSIPYILLVSGRAESANVGTALEATRTIVWFKPPIVTSVIVLTAAGFLCLRNRAFLKTTEMLFAVTLAATAFAVFNQQLISGYSMQPFHYGFYAANYLSAISLAIIGWLAIRESFAKTSKPTLAAVCFLLCLWAVAETHHAALNRLPYNIGRDEGVPVNYELREIARREIDPARNFVTLNLDPLQADSQPASAQFGVLWADHVKYVTALSSDETRRRYFRYLYYSDRSVESLRENLRECPSSIDCRELFDWRLNFTLSIHSHQPTADELEAVIEDYRAFIERFSSKDAHDPQIVYAVIREGQMPDLVNLKKWYNVESARIYGEYQLFKLEPLFDSEER